MNKLVFLKTKTIAKIEASNCYLFFPSFALTWSILERNYYLTVCCKETEDCLQVLTITEVLPLLIVAYYRGKYWSKIVSESLIEIGNFNRLNLVEGCRPFV